MLTSAHVLEIGRGGVEIGNACEVAFDPWLDSSWVNAEVRWVPEGDADFVVIACPSGGKEFPVSRFGRLTGSAILDWHAGGFPLASKASDRRVYEHAWGQLPCASDEQTVPLALASSDARVLQTATGEASGWSGMSGATVFVGDVIVGVVRTDPDHWDGRLNAVLVADWLGHDFPIDVNVLDVAGPPLQPLLEVLEFDPTPVADIDRLTQAFRLASSRTRDGLPLYVRRSAANDVEGRLTDPKDTTRFVVAVGPPKAGKTRLMVEAVRRCFPDAAVLAVADPSRSRPVLPDFADRLEASMKLPSGDVVVFVDDLHRHLRAGLEVPLARFIARVCSHQQVLAVVATCHSDVAYLDDDEASAAHIAINDLKLILGSAVRVDSELSTDEMRTAAPLYPDAEFHQLERLGEYLAGLDVLRDRIDGARNGGAETAYRQAVIDASQALALTSPRREIAEQQMEMFARRRIRQLLPSERRFDLQRFEQALDWAVRPVGDRLSTWAILTPVQSENVQSLRLLDALVLPASSVIDRSGRDLADILDDGRADVSDAQKLQLTESFVDSALYAEALAWLGDISDEAIRPMANVWRGFILGKHLGRVEDAIGVYSEVIENGNEWSIAVTLLGHLLADHGRRDEAERTFRAGIESADTKGAEELTLALADQLNEWGRWDDADDLYWFVGRSEDAGRRHDATLGLLAAHEHRPRSDSLIERLRRQTGDDSDIAGALFAFELGKTSKLFENWAVAESGFRAFLAVAVDDPEKHWWASLYLGEVLEALDRWDEALGVLRELSALPGAEWRRTSAIERIEAKAAGRDWSSTARLKAVLESVQAQMRAERDFTTPGT